MEDWLRLSLIYKFIFCLSVQLMNRLPTLYHFQDIALRFLMIHTTIKQGVEFKIVNLKKFLWSVYHTVDFIISQYPLLTKKIDLLHYHYLSFNVVITDFATSTLAHSSNTLTIKELFTAKILFAMAFIKIMNSPFSFEQQSVQGLS